MEAVAEGGGGAAAAAAVAAAVAGEVRFRREVREAGEPAESAVLHHEALRHHAPLLARLRRLMDWIRAALFGSYHIIEHVRGRRLR